MLTVQNIHTKSIETVILNGRNEEIYKQLKADGHKVNVNRYGLKISGRRVSWQQGYWLGFLGTPVGKAPKIVRTL